MSSTFNGCSSLVTAPTIPASITSMDSTFRGCIKLTAAPAIPASVTNMQNTFQSCSSLITAPTIPASVTNMNLTFYGCTNLSGNLQINSSIVSDMSSCFQNVKSLAVKVTVNSTTYTTITTASLGSNTITIETFEPET